MRRWQEAEADIDLVLAVEPGHKKALDRKAALLVMNSELLMANNVYHRLVKEYRKAKNEKRAAAFLDKALRVRQLGEQWESVREKMSADTPLDARINVARECTNVLGEIIQ